MQIKQPVNIIGMFFSQILHPEHTELDPSSSWSGSLCCWHPETSAEELLHQGTQVYLHLPGRIFVPLSHRFHGASPYFIKINPLLECVGGMGCVSPAADLFLGPWASQ